jgi:hypothetical protein
MFTFPNETHYTPPLNLNKSYIIDFLNFIKDDKQMKSREVWGKWMYTIKLFLIKYEPVLEIYKEYAESQAYFPSPENLISIIDGSHTNVNGHKKFTEELFIVDLWMWTHH